MDDLGDVDQMEHQKVMDGFGAQIGRLDRKLETLRDRLIAAEDVATVDRTSEERAAIKKQKDALEKLQQVILSSASTLGALANRFPGRVNRLPPCSAQGSHKGLATSGQTETKPHCDAPLQRARGHRSHAGRYPGGNQAGTFCIS